MPGLEAASLDPRDVGPEPLFDALERRSMQSQQNLKQKEKALRQLTSASVTGVYLANVTGVRQSLW